MKTNLKLFTLAVFAFASLILATAGMAQTSTTGTVEGVVQDANGAVVPNTTVTLSGGNLIKPVTTTSDSDGVYRFLQVPPGRYMVSTAASQGFREFKREDVEVNLSRTSTVNITLTASGATAEVNVVAGAEVDQNTNTTGANISTEFFSNIPTSRTVQGLYTIAPTVARSGLRDASGRDRDPSVAGSSGPENSYILDGVTTTDPAFGGGGANLPFEFVQEVEVKTGSYGAEFGLSTGGIFNVITKSGGNEFHGDVFAYFTAESFVRETKNFPLTGLAPNGFSEVDAGFDIGGPIIREKLWFFGAFNPQFRKNQYLTQSLRQNAEGKIRTPFWAGKLSWLVNNKNTFTFSHFADFTKEEGHLFAGNGFGTDLNSFRGTRETGGTNYAFRLNSNMSSKMIGEFSFGIHRQRNNVIPDSSVAGTALVLDNFAIRTAGNTVVPVTSTGIASGNTNIGNVDYVFSPGGFLERNFTRAGFGLFQDQARNRWEAAARMQRLMGKHTFKFGFEYYKNIYEINQRSTGPSGQFPNPLNVTSAQTGAVVPDDYSVSGYRVTNNWTVCTTRVISGTGTVVCPTASAANAFNALPVANRPTGFTANAITGTLTAAEVLNNPFLIRGSTRVRDFKLVADTNTAVESFYFQDDYRVTKNLQFNLGLRWDFQQANGNEGRYLELNNFWHNMQPRVGLIWDFMGNGKSKFFLNYARYLETPIPLDLNVRAGSDNTQTDKNFNVQVINAPLSAPLATGFGTRNLGAHSTPIDVGLKPQTVNETTGGFEFGLGDNMVLGFRGIYRNQGSVIEDGSFDDGNNYFIFNPGEPLPPGPGGQFGNTEFLACQGDPATMRAPQCFGRGRRYYRAIEITLNRRFANDFAYNMSYVYSSLIGNYEGLFRNDNGQSDPNITSLFDLTSLLAGTYGRLPNDRPHQFKFNGSYKTPFKLVLSGNFYAQSGIPFNALVPHPVYGNNEGFCVNNPGVIVSCVPRGTAIIPNLGANSAGVESAIGKSRTPFTWNLDLGAYFPIAMGEGKELRFTADWFNVTNTQRAVTLDQTFAINSGVSGVPPVLNPFWGSGTIFQYPSALRLGAKFRF